jgi:hypothetical protein
MPALGTSLVELVLEELFGSVGGDVKFHIALIPNGKVDQLVLDLADLDVSQEESTNISLDNIGPNKTVNATSPIHLSIPDAREHTLNWQNCFGDNVAVLITFTTDTLDFGNKPLTCLLRRFVPDKVVQSGK